MNIAPAGPVTPASTGNTPITFGAFNMHDFFDIDHPNAKNTQPESRAHYDTRLSKFATAINDDMHSPDVVGLSEIEDKTVVNDLLSQPKLKDDGYKALVYPTNDKWGENNVLLYKPSAVTLVDSRSDNPNYANPAHDYQKGLDPSKLYTSPPLVADFKVQGASDAVKGANELTVIQNHLKSMVGSSIFDTRRAAEGTYVGKLVDEAQANHPNGTTVVMGDLNSFKGKPEFDNITTRPDGSTRVVDAANAIPANDRYSYYYARGNEKNLLDHIMVSANDAGGIVSANIPHFDSFPNPAKVNDASAPDGVSDHDPITATIKV